MATTTKGRAAREDGNQGPGPENLLAELGEVFESAGANALVYLFRTHPRPPGARMEAYLETFDRPPTFEEIRDSYGGGSYRLRLLDGGKRTKHSVAFSIEGAPVFQTGALPNEQEESRLDRLERLVMELAESRATSSAEDDAEFRRMMNRAIMARSIAEATGPTTSPVSQLKDLVGLLDMLRRSSGVGGADPDAGESVPWWASLAERLFDQMDRARPAGAPAAPTALPPRAPEAELDYFLGHLAESLERGATVEDLEGLVPADQISGIQSVPPEAFDALLRQKAARWPVFLTMPARAKCRELLRRLQAKATAENGAEREAHE